MDKGEMGRFGEAAAASYLEARGWTILARNLRWGRGEVDLVAFRGRILAFVEVKCRSGTAFGHPLEAVSPAKRAEITKVARAWLGQMKLPAGTMVRFDAVGVTLLPAGPPDLLHVPDAWRSE